MKIHKDLLKCSAPKKNVINLDILKLLFETKSGERFLERIKK